MFLAIRTTFWFTLSQYDFVVFALERSLIVPQVSLSTSVRPFVNRCANSLNDFRHCCLNEVVLLINFVRLILTRLAFERFRRFSYAFGRSIYSYGIERPDNRTLYLHIMNNA